MAKEEEKKSALHVQKGVDAPQQVNKQSVRKYKLRRKKQLSAEAYTKGILEGNRSLLSRAITLIESTQTKHQELAAQIISQCLPHSGKSIRIGITGVPGVGKSTFIEAFGGLLSKEGRKLAVLAIDPTSERTGGSILGDKTRMEQLSKNEAVFIRPSPAAGSLGGVAQKTRESILLCEAAGFDTIIIETVGVGQSETAVHSMVDFFLLLMLAGAGDELQGIKRGIMEMADTIAITKADGDNQLKSKTAQREYKNALHLFPPTESGWIPKVLLSSSVENQGMDKIWDNIQKCIAHHKIKSYFEKKRAEQSRYWMYESIGETLHQHFYQNETVKKRIPELEAEVIAGKLSPFYAAKTLLELYKLS